MIICGNCMEPAESMETWADKPAVYFVHSREKLKNGKQIVFGHKVEAELRDLSAGQFSSIQGEGILICPVCKFVAESEETWNFGGKSYGPYFVHQRWTDQDGFHHLAKYCTADLAYPFKTYDDTNKIVVNPLS